jgi:hypothetical protein
MTVIGLVAVCDYVSEEERRLGLVGPDPVWEAPAAPVGEPRPGVHVPRTPAELEEVLEDFRRSASFTVHEFAVLADGTRLQLNDDRGFGSTVHVRCGSGARADTWAFLTLEGLESSVLTTVLPDDDDGEEHPWERLADRLGELGVEVTPQQLRQVPYEVEFSERLRARVPASR